MRQRYGSKVPSPRPHPLLGPGRLLQEGPGVRPADVFVASGRLVSAQLYADTAAVRSSGLTGFEPSAGPADRPARKGPAT